MKNHQIYRWFYTSSGKLVVGGKSAEQNEELLKSITKDYIVMHTSTPGSPFCIIEKPNQKDLEEVAVFTACFSQEWKKNKKNSVVDVFNSNQIMKDKKMKLGTFGVFGDVKKIKVELKLALVIQDDKLRAVPEINAKNKLLILIPGKLNKTQACEKIKEFLENRFKYQINSNDIMAAIPSDKIAIKQIK